MTFHRRIARYVNICVWRSKEHESRWDFDFHPKIGRVILIPPARPSVSAAMKFTRRADLRCVTSLASPRYGTALRDILFSLAIRGGSSPRMQVTEARGRCNSAGRLHGRFTFSRPSISPTQSLRRLQLDSSSPRWLSLRIILPRMTRRASARIRTATLQRCLDFRSRPRSATQWADARLITLIVPIVPT